MKRFAIGTILGLAAVMLFGACSSQDDFSPSRTSTGSVPGEKRDSSSIEPAPGMGAGAKVGF